MSDSFCGSPEYMSPEMLRKQMHGRGVDFYALGTFLYEMLVGIPPFYSEDRQKLYRNIIYESACYPRFLSKEAVSIITGLIEKDPEKRLGY
jgi:serine/threonine protein kinase